MGVDEGSDLHGLLSVQLLANQGEDTWALVGLGDHEVAVDTEFRVLIGIAKDGQQDGENLWEKNK